MKTKIESVVVFVAVAVASFFCASAAEVVFNPTVRNEDGSYCWTNEQNWAGGKLPGLTDVQVFQPEGELTVKVTPKASGFLQFGGMKFLSGHTVFAGITYFYANVAETEIYVAGGAAATCSNMVDSWTREYSLVKTGPGRFNYYKLGEIGYKAIDVREGELAGLRKAVESAVKASSIRIRNGARMSLKGYNYFVGNPDVQVDEGAVFDVDGGSGRVNIGCLTGSGQIIDNNYYTDLQINPPRDCVFYGTMSQKVYPNIISSATGRFILGRADTIAQCGKVTGCKYLGFAPGIGVFDLGKNYIGTSDSPLKLEDTAGKPVKVIVAVKSENAAKFETEGAGSIETKVSATFSGSKLRHTGGITATGGTTLTLGDSASGGDFDFSALASFGASADSTIVVGNAAEFAFDGMVDGSGKTSFRSPATCLANYCVSGSATSDMYGDMTIMGGDATCALKGLAFKDADLTFTLNGGRISRPRSNPSNDTAPCGGPLLPAGIAFNGGQSGTKVVVNGGELHLTGQTGCAPQRLELNGGRAYFSGTGYSPLASATAANPCVIRFNGGVACLSRRNSNYWDSFTPFSGSEALELRVGEKGAVFSGEHVYAGTANCESDAFDIISRPLLSDAGSGVDGGVRQSGIFTYRYLHPLRIAGTYEAEGGGTRINAEDDISSGRYFGSGDTVLRNHRIDFADRTESFSFCPHGQGKKLHVEGVGALMLRESASGAPANIEIEELAVDHGALLIVDPADVGSAGGSSVKLASVPNVAANGRVTAPVVIAKDYKTFSFAGYDAQKGFTNINLVGETSFTNTEPGKMVKLGPVEHNWMPVAAGRKVRADALYISSSVTVELYDKSSITVGDGVNPALLLVPAYGIKGPQGSSLEFGTSQGVVVCGSSGNTMECSSYLRVPIRSANGLTVVGYPSIFMNGTVGLALSGENTYSGDTYINSAIVQAENDRCFSSGTVHVVGGRRYGGGVRFKKDGGVWANDFKFAGWGIRRTRWSLWENFNGAVSFRENGKVTGSVELVDDTRFCVTNEVTGEFAGVISGSGKAELLNSRGVLRFSNSNTYTGGTDIVGGSTLELVRGDSAGSGEILLSGSTLRFVNTEPIVFTNKIVGAGTIELAGAPVTFAGDEFGTLAHRTLAKGTAMTFPNVAEGEILYAAVLDGGTLDLKGRDMAFHDIRGSGTITGGKVTLSGEIHPGGAGSIGTLVFAEPPLVESPAVLVAECDGDSCDAVALAEGDFAIGNLALDFRLIGSARGIGTFELLSTEKGAVSGAFSSFEKSPGRARSAEVVYGEDEVRVRFRQGTYIWIR